MNDPNLMVVGSTGVRFDSARAQEQLLEPKRPGEHVWIVMACYVVTPETIEALETHTAHLDAENIATVQTGCYVCEQPYSKRLTFRRCPGEPG